MNTLCAVVDIFDPAASQSRLDERFKLVADDPRYAPARATMRATFAKMGERDPSFIRQFQTDGFDARCSELYLYAALDAAGFDVSMIGEAPDFMVSGHGHEWALEATTANPSGGGPPPPVPDDRAELQRYIGGELIVRLGSALYSKLTHRPPYWELPHVAGKPFVVAIQNFASDDSLHFADTALVHYLYGFQSHAERAPDGRLITYTVDVEMIKGNKKEISSGFFPTDGAEHISAVLWTNSGTVMKFVRMGFQRGLDSGGIRRMTRVGLRFVPGGEADLPAPFAFDVGDRWESWEVGLVMAHNPNALLPLSDDCFPDIVHHSIGPDGEYRGLYPSFVAFNSKTKIELTTTDTDQATLRA
jgi:hypothetical protein